MKNDILFSIIVPIYNTGAYLDDCLYSIVNQNYQNIEIILVDDHSTDDSVKICQKYENIDNRIKLISNNSNFGNNKCRNIGIEVSRGEYLVFVDSDDYIDKRYISELYKVLKGKEIDIICCNYYIDNNGVLIEKNLFEEEMFYKKNIEKNIYPVLIENEYGKSFPLTFWAKTIKRDICLANKVNADISIGEDAAFIIPCVLEANSLYTMKEKLYFYRKVSTSLTNNKRKLDLYEPKIIYEYLIKRIKNTNTDLKIQLYRKTIHALFNRCISQFYSNDSYFIIRKNILSSLNDNTYKYIITNVEYAKSSYYRIYIFVLKHKLIFVLLFFSIIKRFGK